MRISETYSKYRLILISVSVLMILLSISMIIEEYNMDYNWRMYIFSYPNISIPTFMLALYSLVKSISTKEFNRNYWIDMSCCWIIYCLLYHFGIFYYWT